MYAYQKQLKMTVPTIGWFVGLPETQHIVTVPLVNTCVMDQKKRAIKHILLWSSTATPEDISPLEGSSSHLSCLPHNLLSSTIYKSKQFETI